MDMETFVENAKSICKDRNMAVSTACLNAGLSVTWMSDIEKKHTRPRIDTVIAFAQYLGVTVSELLGETKPTKESAVLRDCTAVVKPSDFTRLTVSEVEMIMAYRMASEDEKAAICLLLRKYKKETTTGAEMA